MPQVKFFVGGIAKPGGSKRHVGGGRIVEDCKKNAAWRKVVADAAGWAMLAHGRRLFEGPLAARFRFVLSRPKSHYRTGRYAHLLKDTAPKHPIVKPDVLKLTRAAEDALTGVVYSDDAQIVTEGISKEYAASATDRVGVEITIQTIGEE